jgi:penicillin-binding protein 1A
MLLIGTAAMALGVFYVVYNYSNGLPDYSQLAQYSPATVTRLYASDGKLLAEYAKEKRIFVPISAIPRKVINAFIAAEDKNFYTNPGIDFMSIFRAAVKNAAHVGQNKSLVGGSTITQQVVKNFLLGNERTLSRKIKEAILSFRITDTYSKDKIMELYLNEIYLGNRSYGVAAAALNYFNKSLDELTIEEAAVLASLPKAPSSLDPIHHPERSKERRDWVIKRMEEDGYINELESVLATSQPVKIASRSPDEIVQEADYFSEAVRKQLADTYGEKAVYEDGLAVRTTLDPAMQKYASTALHKGLIEYDRRHGWRGAIAHIDNMDKWHETLKSRKAPDAIGDWLLAVILNVHEKNVTIGLRDGSEGSISLEEIKWARKHINENSLGPVVKKTGDVLQIGDIVAVSRVDDSQKTYALQQIPEVNGAIVAMDPDSGRVLAMVGGYHFSEGSQFNRALLAKRQPGSSFKPFVYLAALENGFKPNSIIVDEEIKLDQGAGLPMWNPKNYSGEYYGPSTLRTGVEKSRNAMTVRLSALLGIDKVIEIAKRFGINDTPARNFSICLGSAETTLLRMTTAYSMLANGGKQIKPSLLERVQDKNGKNIYKRDGRICEDCVTDIATENLTPTPPALTDDRPQIGDAVSIYQITSILEGVIQRGTGTRARSLGYTLAGKTGTTNESFDTWFLGFSPNLVVGVFVGFDTPKSLGKHETGASAALPVWMNFMRDAMKDRPDLPFKQPSGIKLVKIDHETGQPPLSSTSPKNIIYEAFRSGTEPGAAPSENQEPEQNGGALATPEGENPAKPSNNDRNSTPQKTPEVGNGGVY